MIRTHFCGDHEATRLLEYLVVPEAAEEVLVGKPTLDALGFVSDKETIELRSIGVTFPTVLREEEKGVSSQTGASGEALRFMGVTRHHHLTVPADRSRLLQLEVVCSAQAGRECWLAPGPDLPRGAELVEGCCRVRRGRNEVQLLVHEPCMVGPGSRLVEMRDVSPGDEELLRTVRLFERQGLRRDQFLRQSFEAAAPAEEGGRGRRSEALPKTSYKA